jgi:hypothetical protein
MSVVSVRTWWRRFGVTRPARGGHRSLVAGVLVLGLGALAVGVTVGSGALAVLGIVLAVPQTVEAGRNLRDARRSDGAGFDRRRALARRMLAVRRAEEMAPSIPGGAVIDLDYLPETELVTFRSQDDRVATFDELVTAIEDTGGPLVLVGAPGAGKTFTARWVVTTLLDRAVVDDGPLAERFLLSRWDGSPLTDWLPREWARRREYRLGVAEAADLIADPSVVLVLDGLDEMPNAQRQACVDAINAFVDVHPRVRVVVCCRNREYRGLAQRIESRRAALGRAGEAAQALLPADMDEYDAAMLIFGVPTPAARRLVPDGAFELVEREPGLAQLVIFAEDRSRSRFRRCNELAFALAVRPTRHPREPVGLLVTHRFVSEPLSQEAAQRTLIFFAATMAGLSVTRGVDEVTVDLRVGGEPSLALRVPRGQAGDPPRRIDTTAYSMVGGIPRANTQTMDVPTGVVADPTTVDVVVGRGPVADVLRSLGLPRAPDTCAWGEGLTLASHLPRPLGGPG